MTPAQAAWLRRLRDEGPQPYKVANHIVLEDCRKAGWTATKGLGWKRRHVTPAGLAALEAYERGPAPNLTEGDG